MVNTEMTQSQKRILDLLDRQTKVVNTLLREVEEFSVEMYKLIIYDMGFDRGENAVASIRAHDTNFYRHVTDQTQIDIVEEFQVKIWSAIGQWKRAHNIGDGAVSELRQVLEQRLKQIESYRESLLSDSVLPKISE
jgi:hypothetical protein